ncbi:MAG: hypothetical protein ACOYIF_08500, partial [Acetivibrionales bacterium]
SGTIVHINSAPFAYLSNKPFTEITALNDLFSKLSTVGHVDEMNLIKPVWAFEREEIIKYTDIIHLFMCSLSYRIE